MQLSYSSLETYTQCPLKYKYQAIDKIKTPKSKEAVFGTLIHNTLRFYHEPAVLAPTLEQALDNFARSWNSEIWDNEAEERAAFAQGVEILQKYCCHNNPTDFTIVALESNFQLEVTDPNKPDTVHAIRGIIDRIDKTEDGYEIIDYKTAKKMPSQDFVDNNLQLSIYLKAFLERYPAERAHLPTIKVSLYFVKHGVKLTSTRTEEQLAKVDNLFVDAIRSIEAQQFDPHPSVLCDWCGYQKICPMWRHKFKEERKIDTDEIRQAINDYITAKRDLTLGRLKIAKLQDLINTYMDQEDVERVFGETDLIERAVRQTFKYDNERLHALLAPIDQWEAVRKVDLIALKKTLSSLPRDIRDRIETEAKLPGKKTASFRVKKVKGEIEEE